MCSSNSPNKEELYVSYFKKSIAYIGLDQAKFYWTCTIDKLSEKFNNEEIDKVFSREPDEIQQLTEFAAIECENHK